MNNKMEEVAKILGVELGEKFDIEGASYNPYVLTKRGLLDCEEWETSYTLVNLLNGEIKIAKSLLTKEEKVYLEYILRQYKEYVKDVEKVSDGENEFLVITINRSIFDDSLILPYIGEGDMQYKGLESGKHYTLQELNLFEGE